MSTRSVSLVVGLLMLILLLIPGDVECKKRRKGSSSSGILSGRKPAALNRRGSTEPGPRLRRTACPSLNHTCPRSFSGSPPLILIAMDGFRSDYLTRGLTPTLERLGTQCGVKAKHMRPAFPTTTYPNLYTIVTGLNPETHGIIDNEIYDPDLGEKLDRDRNWANPIWWQKDPLWVTVENQGKKAASYFWLGSDVSIHGVRPSHFRVYNPRAAWQHRVQTVLDWMDMPSGSRPSFVTLYYNQPDNDGHRHGPDSAQVNASLRALDTSMAQLVNGLETRGILGCVNVIILSDHGMTGKSCSRVIPLNQYVDLSSVHYVTGAASRLRPKGRYNSSTIDALVMSLRCQTDKLLVAKKEDLPKRFHFSANRRIEPVILGPTPGWVVRRDSTSSSNNPACTGGTHGYDNMAEEMKALFIAFGPSFKRNLTVEAFSNIEVYNLMADLIGVTPEVNNGTRGSLNHLLVNPPTLSGRTPANEGNECSAIPATPEAKRNITSCTCQNNTSIANQTDVGLHLPWGSPGCSSTLLVNRGSVVGHRVGQDLPSWAAYTLSPQSENTTNSSTNSCWTSDSRLPTAGKCFGSDLNMTTLAPADGNEKLLSSACPMYPGFKSGAYEHMVRMIHQWSANGMVNVVTGPAFDYDGSGTLMSSTAHPDLGLPSHYFIVVTRCKGNASLTTCNPDDLSVQSFLLPHHKNRENCLSPRVYLQYHSCRIRDIEVLTGLKFFRSLEPTASARLRTSISDTLWP